MVRWNKQQTVCCEQRAASHPFEIKLSIIIVQKLFIEQWFVRLCAICNGTHMGRSKNLSTSSVHRVFGGDHYRGGRVKCPLSSLISCHLFALFWMHCFCFPVAVAAKTNHKYSYHAIRLISLFLTHNISCLCLVFSISLSCYEIHPLA